MAYVPNILKKGYAPAWQPKTADGQHEFSTMDGTEYIVYVPSSKQHEAYAKSLKKYKDVFDQIKADIKDNASIAKSKGDGLPKDLDHVEWTALLSATLKKLNKTWGVNDKIWIYNKNYDGTKSVPMYLAITPKITQRNAIRGAQKVSAAAAAGSEFIIDPKNVTFGPSLPPITQYAYVVTKIDGLTYYYHTEKDVDKDNHFMIKNAKGEQVDKNGEIFDPDEDFRRFVQEGQKDEPPAPPRAKSAYTSDDEAEDDYQYESDNERNDYDYNDGIPPYEGARWDYEIERWVSDPMDPEIYDEEGNYRILSEDIVVEPEPEPAPMPMPAPAPIKPQESRRDLLRKRENARRRAHEMSLAKNSQPDVVMPPPPPPPAAPTEAERIAEARIGLPAGWEPLISRGTNMIYYYNQTNGNKQYEVPTEDPRIVEASIGLSAGWIPLISRGTNMVYYYNQSTGNKQYERPTMGGKRTRRRQRAKSRAKQPKKKRITTRRKRTTTRRRK